MDDISKDPFRRQTAINSCIIKSEDHGLTWTPSIRECFEHPMFPSNRFSTPYFIYYGKDGTAPAVDNAEKFIYAVSNNGFWNNGDKYILGRVERSENWPSECFGLAILYRWRRVERGEAGQMIPELQLL